jgi:hypothetical protein
MSSRALIAFALLVIGNSSAYARDLSPFTNEGAATAGLIRFYSQRCGGERGYSITPRAAAFVVSAARAKPAIFHDGYATESHMPMQNCAGAYDYNLGPRGVVSIAIGFTIMRSTQ